MKYCKKCEKIQLKLQKVEDLWHFSSDVIGNEMNQQESEDLEALLKIYKRDPVLINESASKRMIDFVREHLEYPLAVNEFIK